MSEYQPIFDAVRSRIHNADVGAAVESVLRQTCDTSHAQMMIIQSFNIIEGQWTRPSVLFRPTLTSDGGTWCARLGDLAAFGPTAAYAMENFDRAWTRQHAGSEPKASPERSEGTQS